LIQRRRERNHVIDDTITISAGDQMWTTARHEICVAIVTNRL
jgi:hypothetical protein